jgi:PBP1b-binding outer membrane lipoprotein LpoB
MKKMWLIVLLAIVVGCSNNSTQQSQEQQNDKKETVLNTVDIKTFPNDTPLNGFGYDIFIDNKLMVHQPNIPAVAGNRGFASQEEANKIGSFVAHKIKNNIMPPSVTVQELDSLGVK